MGLIWEEVSLRSLQAAQSGINSLGNRTGYVSAPSHPGADTSMSSSSLHTFNPVETEATGTVTNS